MTEAKLVRRLQSGDMAAFDTLFEKHRKGILAYVSGITGDRNLAEDITQDCFVELVRKINRIDPRRGVSAWLYRVARNRSVDVLRHRKHEHLPGDLLRGIEAGGSRDRDGDRPDRQLERKEEIERIQTVLQKLPLKDRELLLLRFYGDLTFREIAVTLRRPLGTVLWQARRSLGKLKNALVAGKEEEHEMR